MLLCRPKKVIDECNVSYLIRLSEVNCVKGIGYLLRLGGLDWKNNRVPIANILHGQFDLSPYLLALGVTPEAFSTGMCGRFQRGIDTPYIFSRMPKVCPICIEELGYCKAEWAYLPVVTCVHHELVLIDFDSAKNKPISWYRSEVGLDFDWSEYESETPNDSMIACSDYFGNLVSRKNTKSYIPKILDGLDFKESLSLFHFVAHYYSRSIGEKFMPVSMANKDRAVLYSKVWGILNDWPDGFHSLLESFKAQPMSSRGVSGVSKHFRDMHERLFRQQGNRGISRAKEEFDSCINSLFPMLQNNPAVTRLALPKDSEQFLGKSAAAELLNCRLPRLESYIKQNRLTVHKLERKTVFRKSEVLNLYRLFESNWTIDQACNAFGVSRYQMCSLLRAGVVKALQSPSNLNREWLVDKQQCEELLQALIEGACEIAAPPSGWTSLAGIQRRYPIDKLIPRMLDGNIQYIRSREKTAGFQQFSNFLLA